MDGYLGLKEPQPVSCDHMNLLFHFSKFWGNILTAHQITGNPHVRTCSGDVSVSLHNGKKEEDLLIGITCHMLQPSLQYKELFCVALIFIVNTVGSELKWRKGCYLLIDL